jgi:hypothetical protein
MLEVRKNTYSKNYENTFFREFARYLHKSFKDRGRSGLLIGSPFCEADERLQIDALLITTNVVCIIDFKNFSGKINIPSENNFESGIWTNSIGDQIKGGSSINPFVQLKIQKRRFSEVYNKRILNQLKVGDIFNPTHTVRVICFQDEIELNGKIPSNETLNFFILDKINFLEGLLDIIDVSDKDVNISQDSYDAFKKIFRADDFKFDDKPLEDKLKFFAQKSASLDYTKLYTDQKSALSEIKIFLEHPEQQVFILQGTVNSGKSYLIPFIQEIAYSFGIQETEVFASSNRVANNLLIINGLERVYSIYSYIYGGQKNTQEKENSEELDEQDDETELPIEQVPLKNCDNSENALFIVDEAQLVSDSFYKSIDLIFGSGYLLKDFLSFCKLPNSKIKIIFIGDPFQLHLGKKDESPLNSSYLEDVYKLQTRAYELLDKPDLSNINKQALLCVDNIRAKYFQSLHFDTMDNFCFLHKDDIPIVVSNFIHTKSNCHILCFSNEDSKKVNDWIKKSIIKNGQDIAKNDLVLFNNNIESENIDSPFSRTKKIYNGQFATVIEVNNDIIDKPKIIKGELTTLKFRYISLSLADSGINVIVLSLENYRLSPKGELSQNEVIAFKIILNDYISENLKSNPFENTAEYSEILNSDKYRLLGSEIQALQQKLDSGEKVKTKLDEKNREQRRLLKSARKKYRFNIEYALRQDPSSDYYKIKNAAFLKFGWAMTVHKSTSYKWEEVIFNVDKTGTTNEEHFRWLYTGISRAKTKVSLINYRPITPFDKTQLVDSNSGTKLASILFISDNPNKENRLLELKEFIVIKIEFNQSVIEKIESFKWQERYHLRKGNQKAIISFSYNGKGEFKYPTFTSGDESYGKTVIETIRQKTSEFDFSVIKDEWRRFQYQQLSKTIFNFQIKFDLIIQTRHKDKIRLYENENELDIEVDYNDDGAFSKIIAKYYNNLIMWHNFKDAIEQLKA